MTHVGGAATIHNVMSKKHEPTPAWVRIAVLLRVTPWRPGRRATLIFAVLDHQLTSRCTISGGHGLSFIS